MSVNRVILVGRLGKDPETRYTSGGQPVCHFTMATDESYKDKSGEKQKRTEWHRITVWGKLAEIAQQYLKKGAQIYVEGSIRSGEWTDKEGQKKTSYEINASNFRMLGSKSDSSGSGGSSYRSNSAAATSSGFDSGASAPSEHDQSGPEVTDEDIPF
jgi:single-strand DNA-binding protein